MSAVVLGSCMTAKLPDGYGLRAHAHHLRCATTATRSDSSPTALKKALHKQRLWSLIDLPWLCRYLCELFLVTCNNLSVKVVKDKARALRALINGSDALKRLRLRCA